MKIFHIFNVNGSKASISALFCRIFGSNYPVDKSLILYGKPSSNELKNLYNYIANPEKNIIVVKPNILFLLNAIRRIVKRGDCVVFHAMHWKGIFLFLSTFPTKYMSRMGYICCGDYINSTRSVFSIERKIAEIFLRYVLKRFAWVNTLSYADKNVMSNLLKGYNNIYMVNYPSLLYENSALSNISSGGRLIKPNINKVRIQVGHRNDPSFCHLNIIKDLESIKNDNIEIYCPLSYGAGSYDYVKSVENKGKEIFGEKFVPLIEYLHIDRFINLLDTIDIFIIYNSLKSQVGLFSILYNIAGGKKAYLRDDDPNLGILPKEVKVFSIKNLEKDISTGEFYSFNPEISIKNSALMKEAFDSKKMRYKFENLLSKFNS